MEEVINEIVAFAKKKAMGFADPDRALIFEELSSRMSDLNYDALRSEYLGEGSDEYLLDGI